MSKKSSGLEPYHYFAPNATKKTGVRRVSFFKSKQEILDFVARSNIVIPPSPTDMLTWMIRTERDSVSHSWLRQAWDPANMVLMEMQIER